MKYAVHDLKVMGLNPSWVKLEVHSTSVRVVLEPKISCRSLEFCVVQRCLVSERTFGVKYDSYTRIKLLMSIIITYYRHIYYHIFAFISMTNLLYFLIQVYFFEEGKNMGIITR